MVKPFNESAIGEVKHEVVPLSAANVQNNVVIPLPSPSNEYNHGVPYFHDSSHYPSDQMYNNPPPPPPRRPRPHMSRDDNYPLDQRLPVEDPDYHYYADNPSQNPSDNSGQYYGQYRQKRPQTTKKPKKIYKAIERVYYYPHNSDSELGRSKDALNQMKEFIPDEPNDDDSNEEQEEDVDRPETRKDYEQMNLNPPRGDHEEPEEVYASDNSGAQGSIARDAKQFGREAVDEAKSFEKFLDNLRNFADNSEKEYSSPSEGMDNSDEELNSVGLQDSEEDVSNPPRYSDSLAAHTADDRTRDYEKISNYGNPEEYDSEKNSYQNQKNQMSGKQRGGHRYHKDRRRPKKSSEIPDEEYERRNKEVSGLIDAEPEEGDYLSNFDVVKQMKNSETKYNTGIDPVYSSQRDFEEVHRLEKMIENVALLNKQKEKAASNTHDRNEATEGSESKTDITKVKNKDDKKAKS